MSLFSSLMSTFLCWLYFPEGTTHKVAGIRSSKRTSPAKTTFLLVVSAMDLTWLHPCSIHDPPCLAHISMLEPLPRFLTPELQSVFTVKKMAEK